MAFCKLFSPITLGVWETYDDSRSLIRDLLRSAELARVVRPAGRVVVSDIHPPTALGGVAFFGAADGASAYVRGHGHSHADYLDGFAAAGLELRRCIEPGFGREEVEMQQPAGAFVPEATEAAYLDLPAAGWQP